MGLIKGLLLFPAPGRFADGPFHGSCNGIRIHDHPAVGIPGRPPDGLDHSSVAAEEPFLVGIQDGYQAHFRHVQPFSEQVDTHQYIELPGPQVMDDLRPFDGGNVRMEVADSDPGSGKVFRQVFCHFLGQGGNKGSFILFNTGIDFT